MEGKGRRRKDYRRRPVKVSAMHHKLIRLLSTGDSVPYFCTAERIINSWIKDNYLLSVSTTYSESLLSQGEGLYPCKEALYPFFELISLRCKPGEFVLSIRETTRFHRQNGVLLPWWFLEIKRLTSGKHYLMKGLTLVNKQTKEEIKL